MFTEQQVSNSQTKASQYCQRAERIWVFNSRGQHNAGRFRTASRLRMSKWRMPLEWLNMATVLLECIIHGWLFFAG